ncbi:M14 family zinc carboxypeptidase [Urechidicola croceus]|uniref:Zinc carboxypeptidase n=1 Tax=Urechidicola croceus TaxID=1850246 RepID=A0A1D8P5J0_9FLAO|nr:M14 family zinc carboxypeptidase [Urechidicola croceus]AOW19836.1 zinc carboxypeptidase [Urechidicola croceus]
MQTINLEKLEQWYVQNYESKISGLRILFKDIEPLLEDLDLVFGKEVLGYSVSGIPIYKVSFGSGKKRILIWSQMHGNESTGTKALFDLFNFFKKPENLVDIKNDIFNNCTLIFVPMLNPDGAIAYTRENFDNIDLNRDAVDKKAIESKMLRSLLDEFNPEYCFNLHDQRTIFNVEGTKNPATISFLAPSEEVTRKITKGRTKTMNVIVAMNNLLQQTIPNHIGRYTDEFYPTATGDNFQKLGHNTILIEAGHYKDDYEREVVRKFNFFSLLQGIHFIATSNDVNIHKSYFEIPNNDKKYFDIIYKNAKISENSVEKIVDIGILFKYKVIDNELVKYDHIEMIGDLKSYYGYSEIDLEKKSFYL